MKELLTYIRKWMPWFIFNNLVYGYISWQWHPKYWTQADRFILCLFVSITALSIIAYTIKKSKLILTEDDKKRLILKESILFKQFHPC